MASLFLFNPENDLALAANSPYYTPPAAAKKIRDAGALIPMWLAKPGDFILAPEEKREEANRMREKYGLSGELFTRKDIASVDKCEPWGWSPLAVQTFRKAGISEEILPAPETIQKYRRLSHRRTSIDILKALDFELLPVEAQTVNEALEAFHAFGGKVFLKFPWSCSGRGVFPLDTAQKVSKIAADGISRQGSVIIEPAYNKTKDFAMLFYCSDGKAHFHALSCFDTAAGGAYGGNMIAPQQKIAEAIGLEEDLLTELSGKLEKALTEIVAGDYSGPVGIDMLIADSPDGQLIVPCVEINLRYTMGFIAAIASTTHLRKPHLITSIDLLIKK